MFMRTAKLAILTALGILSMPSAAMADVTGINTSLLTTRSVTSFNPTEGFWVREETNETANSADIAIAASSNNPTVVITIGKEQRSVVVPTVAKAQALKDALTSQKSVKLIFHAQDCKAGSCTSVNGNVYSAENLEIAFNNVSQPLATYLASVRPTNDELVANQLNQMKVFTQPSEAQPANFQVHANRTKQVVDLLSSAQASDQLPGASTGTTLK